jgi:hypothetical protein
MSAGLETGAATATSGTSVLFDLLNTEKNGQADARARLLRTRSSSRFNPDKSVMFLTSTLLI